MKRGFVIFAIFILLISFTIAFSFKEFFGKINDIITGKASQTENNGAGIINKNIESPSAPITDREQDAEDTQEEFSINETICGEAGGSCLSVCPRGYVENQDLSSYCNAEDKPSSTDIEITGAITGVPLKKCCIPILDGYLDVATLKDVYRVGERVNLTDPLANDGSVGEIKKENKKSFVEKVKEFFKGFFGMGEKEVEIRGNIETIIVDDFENERSETIHFLIKDGKRYKLELKDFDNVPYKTGIVKGILKGDTIMVDSITPTLITDIPPWPQTLGDQRYVVIYLFNETEIPFDVYNYTNITFNSSNQFIAKISYEKASVSAGYVHQDIFQIEDPYELGEIFEYAVGSADPYVNFNEYDGVIVWFRPGEPFYGALGSLGKYPTITDEGVIDLYRIWMNLDEIGPYTYAASWTYNHEMGHNFGLHHASSFECGEYPYRKIFDNFCYFDEYGSFSDTMGRGMAYLQDYSLRNKVDVLGWIDDSNVREVDEGTFFISNFENDSTETQKIHGLKIPLVWDSSEITVYYRNPIRGK